MKKFFVIFEYEFLTYLKNKGYLISTIFIAAIAAIAMFLPRFIDMSDFTGKKDDDKEEQIEITEEDYLNFVLYDKEKVFDDTAFLESIMIGTKWQNVSSEDELKEKVENEEVDGGFVLNSLTEYIYYVNNSDMYDDMEMRFCTALVSVNQMVYCMENNLNYEDVVKASNPEINGEMKVLGKNMGKSYWYCYFLVIIVFMIIILYGVMVATSVTQEKSNRTIEVLVTSVDTTVLFCAKVFAGTFAALLQVGVIFVALVGGYAVNKENWNGMMDFLLDIPAPVIVTFALFGLGGILFYTFIYGAMGALVSKTEDINKSAGSVQMVIMIVYFVALFSLTAINELPMKVLSFLPVSSYSTMFARVAYGTVDLWEIIVSFIILVISIGVVGIVGSKIYRMGTLRYGNPIKLSNALKSIRNKN